MPGAPTASDAPQTPRTARGVRTREALVRAARAVFERDGFLAARTTDIALAAGVASGSFYTYFRTKDEAFAAVMAELQEEMLHPGVRGDAGVDDPVAAIDAANRAYLSAYARSARLLAVMEQVAAVDEGFRRLRLERGEAFAARNARAIERWQRRGLADPALDPLLAAHALDAMVSRMAAMVFVAGEPFDVESMTVTLTRLWVNALRIPIPQED